MACRVSASTSISICVVREPSRDEGIARDCRRQSSKEEELSPVYERYPLLYFHKRSRLTSFFFSLLSSCFGRYKGTRLDDEKDFYEEFFGGDTRSQNVMVSSADESNVAKPLGLDAMLQV